MGYKDHHTSSSECSSESSEDYYLLMSKDFTNGTYRIKTPGVYKLGENITFNPNPKNNFYPNSQKEYSHHAYQLGFFAAITIECSNVILDLNGFTLQQSKLHSLQQRFYANIELANTPFIQGQGPGNFGSFDGSAKHCVIKNGVLGRSSHHGIHGNNIKDVKIQNLTIQNFEVAAIAINGFDGLTIKDVRMGKNRRDVPVNSSYSAARFISLIGRRWLNLNQSECSKDLVDDFKSKLSKLEDEMDLVVDDVHNDIPVREESIFSMGFHKGERLPDGNNYGFLAHTPGAAVMDYVDENTEAILSKNLVLTRVKITNIHANVKEVVGVSSAEALFPETDTSGSVFIIQNVVTELDQDGKPTPNSVYKPNVLADAQLAAAKISKSISTDMRKSSISTPIIDWAESGDKFSVLLDKGYRFHCNGDSMFHVQKGVHGIRMDGLEKGSLKNVTIDNIINVGRMGSLAAGRYEKSHILSKRMGFTGTDSTGISFSYVKNISGDDVKIRSVHSDNGNARGMRFINECSNVIFDRTRISHTTSGYKYKDGCWYGIDSFGEEVIYTSCLPNLIPLAYGVCIESYDDEPSKHIHMPNIKISSTQGVANCSNDYAWQTIHDAKEIVNSSSKNY